MVFYPRSGEDIDRGLVGFWPLNDLRRVSVDGIIAHYKMNDDSADKVVLDSKSGNNGTLNVNTDTISAPGKINEALDFSNDYIELLASSEYVPSTNSPITIMCWFNADSIPASSIDSRMINIHRGSSPGSSLALGIGDNDKIQFYNFSNDSTNDFTNTISTGTWYHVALTYDGTTFTAYFNGSEDGKTVTSNLTSGGSEAARIGTFDNFADYFDGRIDDVRFYERALSLAEIQTIYNSGSGTETTELFRDTIVAVDQAKFNDGVITGATNTDGINGLNPNAMFFDGVDDYIQINNLLEMPLDFSISFWVYDFQTEGFDKFGRYFAAGGGVGAGQDGIRILKNGNSDVNGITFDINDSNNNDFGIANSLIKDKWNHVVAWKVGTLMKFFVNGVQDSTTRTLSSEEYRRDILMNISNQSSTSHSRISNFRIYNRGISDGEVSKLYRLKK